MAKQYQDSSFRIRKPSSRAMEKFYYFLSYDDRKTLDMPSPDPDGFSAAECFHHNETHGVTPPCREPELLVQAKNGKVWHGVTVETNVSMLLEALITVEEIEANYQPWMVKEILRASAKQYVLRDGFVPRFLREKLNQ